MTTTFPSSSAALTSEWLGRALGTRVTGFEIEPIGVGVGLVCDLVRIHLQHDGDGPPSIIAKFPSAAEENRFVALVLQMYGRETRFYRELAHDTPLSSPRCHAVEHDVEADEFVLLLEDLAGARVVDQIAGVERADAEVAIDQLAQFHARWWMDPALESVLRLSDSPFP
jgi:Ecdysteroid kinase-like family